MSTGEYYQVVLTITAPWWKILWARLFGLTTVWCDSDYCVYSARYKGRNYIYNIKEN